MKLIHLIDVLRHENDINIKIMFKGWLEIFTYPSNGFLFGKQVSHCWIKCQLVDIV